MNFELEAGKILAVIGPSGAGKSTLAKALVGAIVCSSGQIRLDGAERNQWPEDQWGETVGYVSQEIALFPGSLAENIARLELQPNPKKVVEAAVAAGIHDMITALPEGYGTEIGPGKMMLSVAKNNGWLWPVRCIQIQRFWFWMNQMLIWTHKVRAA